MGSGNFFSGLLGGYAGTLVKNEERQYTQELAAKELRIHSALTALDAAMKSGDKNAMGLASQNLDEAITSLQDIGKKKPKQKKESPHGGLLQSIIGAIGGGQGQQAPPNLPPMPGVAQGAGGMPRDPGMSAGPSSPQAELPAMPKPVGLGDVLSALPGPEQQAATEGSSKASAINAEVQGLIKFQKDQGIKVDAEDVKSMQEHLAGIIPRLNTLGRVISGAYVDGAELPPDATDVEGKPIGEGGRKKGQAYGIWIGPDNAQHYFPAKPISASSLGGSSSQTGLFKLPDGRTINAFRNPKTGEVTDTSGTVLTGGTFIASSLLPTSSSGVANVVTMDKEGNAVVQQVPTRRVSQKVAPGTSLPEVPQGGAGRILGYKPEPLSGPAKQSLETIKTGSSMIDDLTNTLQSTGLSNDKSFGTQGKLYWEWIKYDYGRPVDPPYDKIIPTAALLRVMLTTPYLRGLRNFDWVERIDKHIPKQTDSPALMMQKMERLKTNLPLLEKAIYETEQPAVKRETSPREKPSSKPASKKKITTAKEFLEANPVQ